MEQKVRFRDVPNGNRLTFPDITLLDTCASNYFYVDLNTSTNPY